MIPRFQHLLVPLDFTPRNQAALEIAFEMSVREPAAVTLLHVVETIHGTEDDDELAEFRNGLEQRALLELDARVQRFADAGVRVTPRVRFGARNEQIVQYAAEHGVDLIIMSSHSVNPDRPIDQLATVSYQVAVLCECPVMLVKQPKSPEIQ